MALNQVYVPKKPNEATPVVTPAKAVEPVANAPEGKAPNAGAESPDDFMSKVTQFEVESSVANKTPDEIDNEVFSDKDFRKRIDDVRAKDPELAKHLELMRKSGISGINNKMQEIAEIRKELQSLRDAQNRPRFSANSIEELLKNPEFLAEANKITGKGSALSDDESLSDAAKQEIAQLKSELNSVKGSLQTRSSEEAQAAWNRHHESLKTKYKNYDVDKINQVATQLASGQVNVTPEYLYKVLYHDENVKKAFEMGRRMAVGQVEEKRQINSIDGVSAVAQGKFQQSKDEDNQSFMQRIISGITAGSPS